MMSFLSQIFKHAVVDVFLLGLQQNIIIKSVVYIYHWLYHYIFLKFLFRDSCKYIFRYLFFLVVKACSDTPRSTIPSTVLFNFRSLKFCIQLFYLLGFKPFLFFLNLLSLLVLFNFSIIPHEVALILPSIAPGLILEMRQKVSPHHVILIDVRALCLAHHNEMVNEEPPVVFPNPPGLIQALVGVK